jgi:dGTP triphosphohydrolase
MSNMTPDQERKELMEAANSEPKVLDDKEVTLADIAKLAGIKEYTEEPKVSTKAKKLVESITAEPKEESSITKAIKESDADDSISTSIKKAVTEESNRLDKIAELESQLAELKAEQKEEQTYDAKTFKEVIGKDIAEYIKNADESQLVELYNTFSDNEAVYNEESSSILVKTPETTEIIADAEKAEAPEEEVVQEKDKEPEKDEEKDEEKDDTEGEVPMLDPEFDDDDMDEEVELPAEDKFTNDLDPAEKK